MGNLRRNNDQLVNSVCPGWTRTERVEELLQDRAQRQGTSVEEEFAKIEGGSPWGEWESLKRWRIWWSS